MSEHRYPRRFVHRSRNTAWAYAEQCGPDEFIYGKNDDGSISGITNHAGFIPTRWVAGSLDDWILPNGHWIETYDHHKDESGMHRHFSAAEPSPANSEVANLRAEVERLKESLAKQSETNARLKSEIYDERRHVAKLQSELAKAKESPSDELELELRRENERLAKERDNQKSEIWTLGESVKWLTTIRDELTKQARLYRDENDRLIESIKGPNGWEATSALQRQQIDEARKERDELRAKLVSLSGEVGTKELLIEQLDNERAAAELAGDALEESNRELHAKLDESEAAAAKMRECLTNVTCALGNLRPLPLVIDGVAAGYIDAAHKALSTTAGREFLAERNEMREENESLKKLFDETEEDRAATHAKLSQMTGRLECCRKNYELCDKDRENALNQLAKLGEEINGPNGWKATCEVQRQTIAAYENGLTTPLSMPERSAYESRANEYRAELQRQLNEAWMRIDYKTADRIADLLGVQRPSDHEKEDLQPAAECGKPVKGVE